MVTGDTPAPASLNLAGASGRTIDYLYDASGNKLSKTVNGIGATGSSLTYYVGPLVFEDGKLKYILHEEGRLRVDPANTTANQAWLYDYFIKDHLGNVRTVVNIKEDPNGGMALYEAGLEVAMAAQEGLMWSHLDEVRKDKPATTSPADVKAAELDGSVAEKRTGTAIMLRVMPGDRFKVAAESYYDDANHSNEQATGEQMITSLVSALTGGSLSNGTPVGELSENVQLINGAFNTSEFTNAWNNMTSQNYDPQKPAAYLNYVLFDNSLKVLDGSGAIQAGGSPQSWHVDEVTGEIEVGQAGYLAVWTANKGTGKVFYDKVRLTYYRGAVVEETEHYYPFGLTLSGQAINPQTEKNNYKLTTKELQDDLGLNWYDFNNRIFDMQRGQWIQHDPLSEQFFDVSPYNYVHNNPVRRIDPTGMGDDSYLYNGTNGNYIATIHDDLQNAAVILPVEPSQEGKVASAVNQLNKQSAATRNETARLVRSAGESHNVDSYRQFYEANKNVAAEYLDDQTPINETRDIRLNGKPYAPKAEVVGNLVEKNGILSPGLDTYTDKNMTASWAGGLKTEVNTKGTIHLHSMDDKNSVLTFFSKQDGSSQRRTFEPGPSPSGNNGQSRGDYGLIPQFATRRSVVVTPNNVYIYNALPNQTVKIPTSR